MMTASTASTAPASGIPLGGQPGLAAAHLVDVDRALVDEAGGGVVDPVRHRRPAERLALDEDAAQLAGLEAALRLHRAQQRLAVQVAIAEVPAQHDAAD